MKKKLFKKYCIYRDINAPVPKSTRWGHDGLCVVIGRDAVIGENVLIGQGVTIGKRNGRMPTIEDDVEIHANAVVIGGITVGQGSIIGAGAVVLKDVPPFTTVVGVWK